MVGFTPIIANNYITDMGFMPIFIPFLCTFMLTDMTYADNSADYFKIAYSTKVYRENFDKWPVIHQNLTF